MQPKFTITILKEIFGIARLDKNSPIPEWAKKGSFYSITNTSDELSIVCEKTNIPEDVKISNNWKIFKIEGPFDFSLVGIMAHLSTVLADGGVSIFTISTFDTDYILVKEENLEKATELLRKAGHIVNNQQ